MESGQGQLSKTTDLKVKIPSETEMISGVIDLSNAAPAGSASASSAQGGVSRLGRQSSVTKTNCLCSPTMLAGSFRCRLHRAPNLGQQSKNIDSQSDQHLRDSTSKPNYATTTAE